MNTSISTSFLEKLTGAKRQPMPAGISPMLATLTKAPFSNQEWLFEAKLDGIRAVTFIRQDGLNIVSRRGHDITDQYPLLANELRQLKEDVIWDGEIVAFDDKGLTSFQRLQKRLNLTREQDIYQANQEIPAYYYIFDILYYGGFNLCDIALKQRKELLQEVFVQSQHVHMLDHFADVGEQVYQAAIDKGFEGIIAKHMQSRYEPGKRSKYWLKIKSTLTDDFIIGGYSHGRGSRKHRFGALLLGYYDEKKGLVYAGHVGTGFDEELLSRLHARLKRLKSDMHFTEEPPVNAPTTWVKPELVAEVKFSQWTQDGYLREPVFLRLREDKSADQVGIPETLGRL